MVVVLTFLTISSLVQDRVDITAVSYTLFSVLAWMRKVFTFDASSVLNYNLRVATIVRQALSL